MNSKAAVLGALAIGVIVLTFPFWFALASGGPEAPPELALPEGDCVEKNMAARHMDLLEQWRNEVVRDGETKLYDSKTHPGTSFERSLTKTCILQCHQGADEAANANAAVDVDAAVNNEHVFCQQCHTYADVRPDCWDCHVGP